MYEVKIQNSISEVNKECWDTLTEDNVFMCYDWLKTFERTTTLPIVPHYIMVFDQEKLIGASVCYFERRNYNAPSFDGVLLGRLQNFRWMRNVSFLPAVSAILKKDMEHILFILRN